MSLLINNPFALALQFANKKVHLGVCGSVACYKSVELTRILQKLQISVSTTLTRAARKFISPLLFQALGAKPVYGDLFEDANIFAHLEPAQKADALLVAPASANTLAKLACGLADDELSCQALTFSGPIIVAPAMNPRMWASAAVRENCEKLAKRGVVVVKPGEGTTACGEVGEGRLADLDDIFFALLKALSPQDFKGVKVLVTLGPTREYWDGVRFLSNPSSGKMGAALATGAWLRGAEVYAVCGPDVNVSEPEGVNRVDVVSADEMASEARKIWPRADIGVFTAAVCDFVPQNGEATIKIKKENAPLEIKIAPAVDVLGSLAKNKAPNQKILGFAAEIVEDADALYSLAMKKLKAKNMNLIAGNRVNRDGGAFGADETSIVAIDRDGESETWPPQPKADVAWELLSWLLRI